MNAETEDRLRDALIDFVSENFSVDTSERDCDYGEQTVVYESDRTSADRRNKNRYDVVDDIIDCICGEALRTEYGTTVGFVVHVDTLPDCLRCKEDGV